MVRAVLTALGVGLGVACLLFAASIPSMMQAHRARSDARDVVSYGGPAVQRSDSTILIGLVDTAWRDQGIRGQLLQPEGPHAPVPPGLTALPGARPTGGLARPAPPARLAVGRAAAAAAERTHRRRDRRRTG